MSPTLREILSDCGIETFETISTGMGAPMSFAEDIDEELTAEARARLSAPRTQALYEPVREKRVAAARENGLRKIAKARAK